MYMVIHKVCWLCIDLIAWFTFHFLSLSLTIVAGSVLRVLYYPVFFIAFIFAHLFDLIISYLHKTAI